ncbi:MAG: chain-length determining protein [Gammaproteobacteria bacterium]|nr:MAG: chain-length determining protein [Gammaproteobacteria bacterium]
MNETRAMEWRGPGVQSEALDVLAYLQGILRGCWRFRWAGAAAAWLLCLAGWLVVLFLPDVYRATARVYVDTQSALRPLLEGLTVDSNLMSDVDMMAQAMLSQPNLEKVVVRAGLVPAGAGPEQIENKVNQIRSSIKVDMDRNDVLQIAYEYTKEQAALNVVSMLLDEFIKGSLGESEADTRTAQAFLEEKLAEYEARLNEAEQTLADFKRRNVGMMPGEEGDYYQRLQTEMKRLDDIESRLRLARQRRDDLRRQLEGETPVFGLMTPRNETASTPFDQQIAAYEDELARLRLKYTDTHPDVEQVLAVLEGLRQKREEYLASRPADSARPGLNQLDANPVYQQMKLQLNQAELRLGQLEAQRRDQAAVVRELREKVDTIPQIEAELTRLTRNYDVTREQYEQLLMRLESARLSEAAEDTKNDVTFRVIDPPALDPQPVGPKRNLLLTAVLLVGLAAGGAVTVLLNFARPVFNSQQELERLYGVAVLGTIQLVRDAAEAAAARRSTVFWASSMLLLLGLYAGLLLTGDELARQLHAWPMFAGVAT